MRALNSAKTETQGQRDKLRGEEGGASTSGRGASASAGGCSSRTERRVVATVAATLGKYDPGSRGRMAKSLLDRPVIAEAMPEGVSGGKEEEVRRLFIDQGVRPFLAEHSRGNTDKARELEAQTLRTLASGPLQSGRLVASAAR